MQDMMNWAVILLHVLIYNVCVGAVEQEPSRTNDYLIMKWGKWFTLLDFNHDGNLSMDDPTTFEAYYIAHGNLSDQQLKTMKNKMDKLWKTFVFTNKKEVSKEDFLSMLKQRYESNTTALIGMMRVFPTDWCEAIDLNGDKFLSKDEFILNFVAETHNNIQTDEKFFYMYHPINERVALDDVIESFVLFVTEPDEAKSDIVLNAIDSGL
ncbi:sarcoplasmic calcium-binding protein-like [Ruditapes philippinarum]|uniref:sarcoplasmic calcium-binding protein-like n=1 Tax=Ruditapes philippinarum TaxID=129788 RepID=UPI00295A99B0|nr:sarcoplasmic calcium-binding protein-like [Ruditapes philippinarum]